MGISSIISEWRKYLTLTSRKMVTYVTLKARTRLFNCVFRPMVQEECVRGVPLGGVAVASVSAMEEFFPFRQAPPVVTPVSSPFLGDRRRPNANCNRDNNNHVSTVKAATINKNRCDCRSTQPMLDFCLVLGGEPWD